jgi:hypothetical protein
MKYQTEIMSIIYSIEINTFLLIVRSHLLPIRFFVKVMFQLNVLARKMMGQAVNSDELSMQYYVID